MTAWIFVSSFIGIIHGHGAGPVATDFFRVIYVILIIPFIYYVGEHRFSVNDLVRCLFVAAGVVAILTVFISLTGKFIDDATFHHFYEWINGLMPGDLFFRPSRGVFYKSDFLVMFAVIIGLIKLAGEKDQFGRRHCPNIGFIIYHSIRDSWPLSGDFGRDRHLHCSESRHLFLG